MDIKKSINRPSPIKKHLITTKQQITIVSFTQCFQPITSKKIHIPFYKSITSKKLHDLSSLINYFTLVYPLNQSFCKSLNLSSSFPSEYHETISIRINKSIHRTAMCIVHISYLLMSCNFVQRHTLESE